MPSITCRTLPLVFLSALLVASTLTGCGARDGVPWRLGEPAPEGEGGAGGGPATISGKVDLLFVIDNSRSMGDKQHVLSMTLRPMVWGLVNPPCVDDQGVPAGQPTTPKASCPAGTLRQFHPIQDLHVAVMTTSIGGHGADACSGTTDAMENDHAHLIDRDMDGNPVATYAGLGYLAWDPAKQLSPPGEDDAEALADELGELIMGAGQKGCGFEAQLESWYRFLIDPNPHKTVTLVEGQAVATGTDAVLLQQRKDFMRSDSLLAIVVLSDENDCSIRDGGYYYFAAQMFGPGSQGTPFHLPKPRAACAQDPYGECCRSCGQDPGADCDTSQDDCSSALAPIDDQINVRCFDQKRRFGIDFLYPVDRYVTGLTSSLVPDRDGELQDNPIFSDLDTQDDVTAVRDPGMVYLSTIVGVPWQDIARRNSAGNPDLVEGFATGGRPVGGFHSPAELVANDVWDLILGDPTKYHTVASARPEDPLMRESISPRTGTHPITGDPIAPPGSAVTANAINGHEYSIPDKDDLQYACIFPLETSRNCTIPGQVSCECDEVPNDNPLCQDDSGQFDYIQRRTEAYPGMRELWLVKRLNEKGGSGVLGSICPRQTSDPSALDYAYMPAVRTLLEAMTPRLPGP